VTESRRANELTADERRSLALIPTLVDWPTGACATTKRSSLTREQLAQIAAH